MIAIHFQNIRMGVASGYYISDKRLARTFSHTLGITTGSLWV